MKRVAKLLQSTRKNSGKATEEQGKEIAKRMTIRAIELDIPAGTALFLTVDENDEMTRNYMRGYAEAIVGLYGLYTQRL